jgi:glycosyltransferase involved in cell wall biosynthesis
VAVRRVAFLSYYFPPIGGAGAQRPARFVRYLRELGWDPLVVTGPGPAEDRWTPRDEALAADVPDDVEVRRVPGPEPAQSSGRAARAERWLGAESPWSRWWIDGAVEAAGKVADIDLVYAWMSPFESATAAAELAHRLRVPWVADLGDPWALDEMMVYPTRLHRRLELRRMRRALASADTVVMSTPEAVRRVRRAIPELGATEVVSIPNGFDAADFAEPAEPRRDGAFRIVHTGYLHTEMGLRQRSHPGLKRLLGGTSDGVDFLTRSHYFLLQAVDRVLRERPDAASMLEVHLAGVASAADLTVAAGSPVTRMAGYLPHDETLELVRTADLLFLPMQDLPPGVRAGIVPGKTYEYLGSGRRILAAVPEGDARDLLLEAGGALLCSPSDAEGMAAAIASELDRFVAGDPALPPDPAVVGRYEYRKLAGRLASVFERLTGRALAVA